MVLLLVAMFLHIAALGATWAPYHWRLKRLVPRYPPLIHPDRERVRFGRGIVFATTANGIFTWINRDAVGASTGLAFIWSAFLAVGVLIAAVWALSPEYLFPQRWLEFLFEDRGHWPQRLQSKRAAPPLEPWLAGLFECCEKVASNPKVPIDCLELQSEVDVHLESRACLIQHRKLLTHEGFRQIRRFVQAVDALDCRATNALAWQSVAGCAKSVLELRDRSAILRNYYV